MRPLVRADPGHGAGQRGDGVVVVAEGAVTGVPVRDQVEPGQTLLRGLDQVEPQVVADGHREPANLADALLTALENLGVLLDQPQRALGAAGLLVGGEDQPEW